MKRDFREVSELITEAKDIVILGHSDGDSDCYGSMFALAEGLTSIGKKATIVMNEDFPSNLDFLLSYFDGEIVTDYKGNADLIFLMDASDLDRISASQFAGKQAQLNKKIIQLDHHTKGDLDQFATVSVRDEEACSTAEIVYELLSYINIEINKEIATCLLAGIVADTGSFENQNTNKACLKISSELLAKGARLKIINQHLFGTKNVDVLKLWGMAMERLTENKKLSIAHTFLTFDDIQAFGLSAEAISGVVNYLNQIAGAKMVVLVTEETKGQVKISLRTRDDNVNVAKLARQLGGGGHVKAAGASFSGNLVSENGVISVR